MKVEQWELINAPAVSKTQDAGADRALWEFDVPGFSTFRVFFQIDTDCTSMYVERYATKQSSFSLYVSHDWLTNGPRWHLIAASFASMIKSYTVEEAVLRLLSLSPDDELYTELLSISKALS